MSAMINLSHPSLWRTQALISGSWCDANTKKTFAVKNPATGEIIAQVADVGVDEYHCLGTVSGLARLAAPHRQALD